MGKSAKRERSVVKRKEAIVTEKMLGVLSRNTANASTVFYPFPELSMSEHETVH